MSSLMIFKGCGTGVTRPRGKGKVAPERSLGIKFVSVALVFHLGL